MASETDIIYFIQVLRWIGRTAAVAFIAGAVAIGTAQIFSSKLGAGVLALGIVVSVVTWARKTYPAREVRTRSRM